MKLSVRFTKMVLVRYFRVRGKRGLGLERHEYLGNILLNRDSLYLLKVLQEALPVPPRVSQSFDSYINHGSAGCDIHDHD